VALHPAAHHRFRDLVENLGAVLGQGDSVELVRARTEFRRLIRSVDVTPREGRGAFDVTVESEMAAMIAQDGHIVTMGAGTRTDHKLRKLLNAPQHRFASPATRCPGYFARLASSPKLLPGDVHDHTAAKT
jgi:hypothetical protein